MRPSGLKAKAVAFGVIGILGLTACGSSTTAGGNLASDQTFKFSFKDDVSQLDPADVDSAVDIVLLQNMFVGLYKFDDHLGILPYGATALPDISSDGMTYTFHLRQDMKFSNGDPVTAQDYVYSWTRTAKHNASYESNVDLIVGAPDVAAGKATSISGLTTPDKYTLVAKVSAPNNYFVQALALPTATEAVDKKVVEAAAAADPGHSDTAWTQKAETYIGSGPFKMTARVPKESMDFANVSNWWGGSTGTLTHVRVDIGLDDTARVKKFESGGSDSVGPGNNSPGPDDVLRFKNDPTKKDLLTIFPGGRSTGLGFNFTDGPFAPDGKVTPGKPTNHTPDAGLMGRQAISLAIDRAQLIDVACAHGITCAAATGGPLPTGFKGNLGVNGDPYAKFDPQRAKTLLDQWDPGKTKRNNIQLFYNTNGPNDALFGNVQAQLKANLDINVSLEKRDFPTLKAERKKKTYTTLFRESWSMDYSNPQDWFDNLSVCAQAAVGKGNDDGYCNPDLDKLVASADTKPLDQAVPQYTQAIKILTNDVVWAMLIYGTQPEMNQKWVKGNGYNGLYDYEWKGVSILQH